MIDWVTSMIYCPHEPIKGGVVLKTTPEGEVEWETACALPVLGSHDSRIQVKSHGAEEGGLASHLWISGNPSKYLQGHNIFGSDDLLSINYDMFKSVCKQLSIFPTREVLQKAQEGAYKITRIDINYSFELPTRSDVNSWLRAAELKSKTRHGRPSMKGGTVYWGKTSRRWAIKAYCKGEEIEAPKHKLPLPFQSTKLPQWADNKLRIELVLRSLELTDLILDKAKNWTPTIVRDLFDQYVRRIEMSQQIALTTKQRLSIPQRLRSSYILWENGEDLRSTLPKATYYRHRKDLLKHGIDIAITKETKNNSNVIPLVRVLEAQPAIIPSWAYSENLIHISANLAS